MKRLLLQNVCDLSNNMNGLRFPCFVKSGNAEVPYVLLKLPATESGALLQIVGGDKLIIPFC